MPQSVLEMTKDLVSAEIQIGRLSPEDMDSAMRRIYQSLQTLKSREDAESLVPMPAAVMPQALANWRQSITRQAITCLECGRTFKQLSYRHLRQHDLDARSYRAKFGIPLSQPLAARATAALRRRIAAEVKPWEKSRTYIKAQQAKATTAKKSGRKKATRTQKR